MKTVSASVLQAADTKHEKLTLWTRTATTTPRSGARRGLTLPTAFWSRATARSASTTAAMNGREGIEQIPTVHIGVAASQMEKKGIVTERGELNRRIKAANRMLREIRAQVGKPKEWLSEIFKAKEALQADPQQPKSTDLSTLLFRYLDIQKVKGRKYSQSWQQQNTAEELKAISKAVNLLAEKGIFTLEELDAALSSVSDKAS